MNIIIGKNSKLFNKIKSRLDFDYEFIELDKIRSEERKVNKIIVFKNIHDAPDKNKKMISSICESFPDAKILIFQSFVTFYDTRNKFQNITNCGFKYQEVDIYSESKYVLEGLLNKYSNLHSLYISSINLKLRYKIFLDSYFLTSYDDIVLYIQKFISENDFYQRNLVYKKYINNYSFNYLPNIKNVLIVKIINKIFGFNFNYYRLFKSQCKNTSL